jgi:hypothetical protein
VAQAITTIKVAINSNKVATTTKMENQPKATTMVNLVVLDLKVNVVTAPLPMAITRISKKTEITTTETTAMPMLMVTSRLVNVVVDLVAHLTDPLPS